MLDNVWDFKRCQKALDGGDRDAGHGYSLGLGSRQFHRESLYL